MDASWTIPNSPSKFAKSQEPLKMNQTSHQRFYFLDANQKQTNTLTYGKQLKTKYLFPTKPTQ